MNFGEQQLVQRIKDRFCMPEYSTIANVQGDQGRFADALAVNLWRSRGYAVIGFEVKSARSDWLRELRQPAKAEGCAAYCHSFFVVANDGVVKVEELPLGWGLMEPHGQSLRVRVQPKQNEHRKELTRSFMVNIIRRASEKGQNAQELTAARLAGREEGIAEGIRRNESREDKTARELLTHYEQLHAQFKERTGIEIRDWMGAKELAGVYRLSQELERIVRSLTFAKETLRRNETDIGEILKKLTVPTDG